MYAILVANMHKTIPSEELTHFDIGWLAGIVEGEGSIAHYYSKTKRGGKPSPMYGVCIVNTDLGILNRVKVIYDKMGLFANINPKSASKKLRVGSYTFTKPCYELIVRRRLDVEKLLKLIAPYMWGYKKQKAEALLKFFSLNPFNTKKQIRA